jgi:large subunit ribosomal protein L4
MPKAKLYDMNAKEIGEIELSDAVFGITPNQSAVYESVKNHLANLRQGTQSTLTRAEVAGGGRKPWRQKGTGHARHGSTRSPQWTHGGVAFGPKPRSYRYTLNKKLRRLALLSALSAKAEAGQIMVVDSLAMDDIKTKAFAGFLNDLGAKKPLVITLNPDEKIIKSARNIQGVKTTFAGVLSVYDIVNHGSFIIDKEAVKKIEEVYA